MDDTKDPEDILGLMRARGHLCVAEEHIARACERGADRTRTQTLIELAEREVACAGVIVMELTAEDDQLPGIQAIVDRLCESSKVFSLLRERNKEEA
jgi:hypothetical protein